MLKLIACLKHNVGLAVFIGVALFTQAFLVYQTTFPQLSDAKTYVSLAHRAMLYGTLYPTTADVYTDYIFAPGYVNFLQLCFSFFDDVRFIQEINIFLNFIIIIEIVYIGKVIFSRATAKYAIVFFLLSVTNYGIILYTSTEQLFVVLSFGAICFALQQKRKYSLVGGICIALANWVRPLGIVFVLGILVLLFVDRTRQYYSRWICAGMICTILLIGGVTYRDIGYFNFQSTTAGVNLLMGANDFAEGNYSSGAKINKSGEMGSIPDKGMTFKERDAYRLDKAIQWIVANPNKYLKLFPKKLFYLYSHDLSAMDMLPWKDGLIESTTYLKEIVNGFPRLSFMQYIVVWNQFIYMLTMIFSFCGLWFCFKNKNYECLFLLFIWICGTFVTIMTVGGSRYHYPYMPIIYLFAGYYFNILRMKYFRGKQL